MFVNVISLHLTFHRNMKSWGKNPLKFVGKPSTANDFINVDWDPTLLLPKNTCIEQTKRKRKR